MFFPSPYTGSGWFCNARVNGRFALFRLSEGKVVALPQDVLVNEILEGLEVAEIGNQGEAG